MQRENTNENTKQNHRDHREMIVAVLENLQTKNDGACFRYLLYTVETAWNTLLPLLDELLDKDLIATKALPDRRRPKVFFITPKGIKFLHLYRNLIKEYLS